MAESLGDQIAARLLDEIIEGRYPPGTALPPEWELADREGASRLTIREAVRILRQKNVVTVVRGRGTFVQPRQRWSPLDPAVLGALAGSPDALTERLQSLLEARALVEVGVAELAAARRGTADLAAMTAAVRGMRDADVDGDVEGFVTADLAFHDAVMAAAGNLVIAALFDPIALLLRDTRLQTSRDPVARAHALRAHERILAAIERRDPVQAAGAMRDHLAQTGEDFAARRAADIGGSAPQRTASQRTAPVPGTASADGATPRWERRDRRAR
jgi:DNA-binding FadR family transcriptional regulator